jgi:hypothetical protein
MVGLLLGARYRADAHSQSTAFLTLKADQSAIQGEWHLALRDLEDALGVDRNDDGMITWDELRQCKEAICAYAVSRLHVRAEAGDGRIHVLDLLVDNHADGAYAVIRFAVEGVNNQAHLQLDYRALFEIDPKHRGLLRLQAGGRTQTGVFSPENPTQQFELNDHNSHVQVSFLAFVKEGIWHIWSGYDHMLFLLALLLPGVLRRRNGTWEPVPAAKVAVGTVLKIVTAFTVAHSITLSLSVLGIIQLPTRLIESAIAASVAVAALNNLLPFYSEHGWAVAFGFGLLHGFGFANALRDLGLHQGQLAITLFGFNLGVELGQLAIVAIFLPVALSLRTLLFYPRVLVRLASALIVLLSATWFAERLLDFKWLPF